MKLDKVTRDMRLTKTELNFLKPHLEEMKDYHDKAVRTILNAEQNGIYFTGKHLRDLREKALFINDYIREIRGNKSWQKQKEREENENRTY